MASLEFEQVPQSHGRDRRRNRVIDCTINCSDISHKFGGLDRHRVGCKHDIFVSHLECRGEEVTSSTPEIEIVDDGNNRPLEPGTVDP